MITAGLCLLVVAALLQTKLGRLKLAIALLWAGNRLSAAGGRALDSARGGRS